MEIVGVQEVAGKTDETVVKSAEAPDALEKLKTDTETAITHLKSELDVLAIRVTSLEALKDEDSFSDDDFVEVEVEKSITEDVTVILPPKKDKEKSKPVWWGVF